MSWEVDGGSAVGPWRLGTTLYDVMQIIQDSFSHTRTDIHFEDVIEPSRDILVSLPELQTELCFDPSTQRLRLIRVRFPCPRDLTIGGAMVAPSSTRPRLIEDVQAVLGPTFPGRREKTPAGASLFLVPYEGMTWIFEEGSDNPPAQDLCVFVGSDPTRPEVPVMHPASSGSVARLAEFQSALGYKHLSGDRSTHAAGPDSLTVADAVLSIAGGRRLDRPGPSPRGGVFLAASGAIIALGMPLQTVLSELGPPCRTRSVPTRPGSGLTRRGSARTSRNYFSLGLDVVTAHTKGAEAAEAGGDTVAEIVLHTNPIRHPDMCQYAKANIRIDLVSTAGDSVERSSVQVDSGWPAVERLLGAGGRPLVVHPTAGEPFGPRLVFGLRGVAVEVLESEVVASVALFQVAGKGS